MIALLLTLALAQDLPPTTCDDETKFCTIHKERLGKLVDGAARVQVLKTELLRAADEIDELGDELETVNKYRKADTDKIIELREDLAVSNLSTQRARRQRNVAYVVSGGVVSAVIAGAYIASRF